MVNLKVFWSIPNNNANSPIKIDLMSLGRHLVLTAYLSWTQLLLLLIINSMASRSVERLASFLFEETFSEIHVVLITNPSAFQETIAVRLPGFSFRSHMLR